MHSANMVIQRDRIRLKCLLPLAIIVAVLACGVAQGEDGEVFVCGSSGQEEVRELQRLPKFKLNDDYCDCEDGR